MISGLVAAAVLAGCAPCHFRAHSGVHIVGSGDACFIEAKQCIKLETMCRRPGDKTVVARQDSPSARESRSFYVQPRTAASALLGQLSNNSVYVVDASIDFDARLRVATISGSTLACGKELSGPLPMLRNFTVVRTSRTGVDNDAAWVLVVVVLFMFIFIVLVVAAKVACRRSWSRKCFSKAAYGIVLSILLVAGALIWIETA